MTAHIRLLALGGAHLDGAERAAGELVRWGGRGSITTAAQDPVYWKAAA